MYILAMDTVGQQGSVALLTDQTSRVVKLEEPTGHVVSLPREIGNLLKSASLKIQDIDLVTVTIGPGSFTGLRIALAMAKGLALGQGVDVVGVSTLDAVAAGSVAREPGSWVAAVLDARRKELFFQLYRLGSAGLPEAVRPPFIADPLVFAEELADDAELTEQTIYFNGSGLMVYSELFERALGRRFVATAEPAWNPDPLLIAKMGLKQYKERGADNAALLKPLYLRRPDAVVKNREL